MQSKFGARDARLLERGRGQLLNEFAIERARALAIRNENFE
jgi:hypothetical protein